MPSFLQIVSQYIVGLRCFVLLIRTVAMLALMSIDITGCKVKPLEFTQGPLSAASSGDGIAFVTIICKITAAPWHSEVQFVIRAIVYNDDWVRTSDVRFLKHHFAGHIVMKNTIHNPHSFHAEHHSRRWFLCLLDLTLDCSKTVVIHFLLFALW
jgi:hypothetical protein